MAPLADLAAVQRLSRARGAASFSTGEAARQAVPLRIGGTVGLCEKMNMMLAS